MYITINNDKKFPKINSGRGIKLKRILVSDEITYRWNFLLINWDRASQLMIKNETIKVKQKRIIIPPNSKMVKRLLN